MKKIKLIEGNIENYYLDNLEHGDYVKVWNGKEKIWVMITSIQKNFLQGIISSHSKLSSYIFGDLISFHMKHIFDVMKFYF